MAKRNCLVGGKVFEACNHCSDTIDEALQWRRVVCSVEHYRYHEPIILYVRGLISKEEAADALKKAIADYGMIEFVDNIKPVVDELLNVGRILESAPVEEKPVEVAETETKSKSRSRSRSSGTSRIIRYDKNDK